MAKIKKRKLKTKVKRWFCNRLGVISTEEYDLFLDEIMTLFGGIDKYVIRQDSFNRLVGGKLGLNSKLPKKDFNEDVNYG